MKGKKIIIASYLIGLGVLLLSFAPGGENAPQTFSPAAPTLRISPATIPGGKYGSTYKNQNLKVTGGKGGYSFTVSAGNLPPGISLSNDGILSGVPAAAGTYSFTVGAAGKPRPGNDDKGDSNTASQDYTLNVAQVPLTIAASSATINYGSAIPVLTVSYSGFVHQDDISSLSTPPSITTAAVPSSPAGAYPITASGAVDSNYSINYKPGTLTIKPATLVVTANAQVKEYGAADPIFTYAGSGFVNGNSTEVFTGSLSRTPGEGPGAYPIIKGSLSAGGNYTINFIGSILTINTVSKPAPVKISPAAIPGGQYGSTYNTLGLKVTGGKGPYSFSVATGKLPPGMDLSNDGTLSGTPAGAGTFMFTVAAAGESGDAKPVTQDYTFVVGRASLTITANNATINYGSAIPALTVSYSGFVNKDNVSNLSSDPSVTTSATASSQVGAYPITASGAVDSNYTFTYKPGTLGINPAVLAVTANAQKKDYGAADPTLTYSTSGFVNGNNTSIFTGSLSRTRGEAVGSYPITKGSLSAGRNYTISFTGNNLIISVASQHITWTQSLLMGCNASTTMHLNATASSGLPVTYSVSDGSIATITGNVLRLLRPGTTVVTATQPGDANHAAAQPVADTLLYQSASLVRQHWNDALIFDNSSGNFVQWQWYKNGQAVPGAISPYYSEGPMLKGQYYVIAVNGSGQQIQSCLLTIKGDTVVPQGIKVQPNPVGAGAVVNVTSNYTAAALQGAILQVIDLNGKVWQKITAVQPSMQITMPSEHGIYVIRLLLTNGEMASTNALVLN